ncbi:hypothetical protein GS436_17300 [Rhodococcus hoagii]|nr:hypothetical protein [Prescottella equi]
MLFPAYWITWYLRDTNPSPARRNHPVCDSRRMGNQRHADTTQQGSRGSAAKALVIAAICLIGGLTFTGLPTFETSLWIAYAVTVMVEIALAVVLFFSRWTNKRAAVVLVLLALFQAGQTYFNEQMRYTSADPVIPIDNFGVLVLCASAVYLIKKGQPWPVLPHH